MNYSLIILQNNIPFVELPKYDVSCHTHVFLFSISRVEQIFTHKASCFFGKCMHIGSL
jgi:hypothetical protein